MLRRRSWQTRLLAAILAGQIAWAGAGLYHRNVNLEGQGELPFTWQMYSGRR